MNLDFQNKLPRFASLIEEVESWHAETYAPIAISLEQSAQLGLGALTTKLSTNSHWPTPDWATIIHGQVSIEVPTIEFTILLPDFMIGQSEWSGTLRIEDTDGNAVTLTPTPDCYITPAGVALHYKIYREKARNAKLSISYHLNHYLATSPKSHAVFFIQR